MMNLFPETGYQKWLESKLLTREMKEELLSIRDDKEAIEDRFYTELSFGTAGLRGIIGAGPNRMNILTVKENNERSGKLYQSPG